MKPGRYLQTTREPPDGVRGRLNACARLIGVSRLVFLLGRQSSNVTFLTVADTDFRQYTA